MIDKKDMLINKYYEWLTNLVFDKKRINYIKLLSYLHSVEFTFINSNDSNRAQDGVDLRRRFSIDIGLPEDYVESVINGPCSVLEMMVALAIRCEEQIMASINFSNRTNVWFWLMIQNLQLESQNDIFYDKIYVADIIDRFLKRDYKRNGEGGLFIVDNCKYDLRQLEIWYQANWYFSEVIQ